MGELSNLQWGHQIFDDGNRTEFFEVPTSSGQVRRQYVDAQYNFENISDGKILHNYGDNVHIFFDPFVLGKLDEFCSQDTNDLDRTHSLLEELSQTLVEKTATTVLPWTRTPIKTQMYGIDSRCILANPSIDRDTPIVFAELIRAGTPTTHYALRRFASYMNPGTVSRHAIQIQRKPTEDGGMKADLSGAKVEPLKSGTYLWVVDPMGATGTSTVESVGIYHNQHPDFTTEPPERIVLSHLIITPEYVMRVQEEYPDAQICALRLDRAFSTPYALGHRPGAVPDQEFGLTNGEEHGEHHSYIGPGAGDIGARVCGTTI